MGNLLKGSEADFFYAFTFQSNFGWRVRKMKNLLEYQNITLISITELATAFRVILYPLFKIRGKWVHL